MGLGGESLLIESLQIVTKIRYVSIKIIESNRCRGGSERRN